VAPVRKGFKSSRFSDVMTTCCVVVGAEKMQRNVGLVAHHPTVVPGRAGWNIKEHPGAEFMDGAILHRGSGASRNHEAHMLHMAPRRAHAGTDVDGPLPSRLVGGTADGHSPDVNEFEFPFFESSNLVGLFETLQNCLQLRHSFKISMIEKTRDGCKSGQQGLKPEFLAHRGRPEAVPFAKPFARPARNPKSQKLIAKG
jgi:hypothetical protein